MKKTDAATALKDIDKDIHFPVKGTSRIGELIVNEGPAWRIHFFIDDSDLNIAQDGGKDVNLENDNE